VLLNKVERPPGEVIPEITDGAVLEPRNVLLIKSNWFSQRLQSQHAAAKQPRVTQFMNTFRPNCVQIW
jgi:hypothetical protein